MKILSTLLYITFILMVVTGCSEPAQHDHIHTESESDHNHTEEIQSDHDHTSEVDDNDDHNHAPIETEHNHAEEAEHDHEDSELNQDHTSEGDEHDDYDEAGLITTDSNWEELIGLQTAPVERRSLDRTLTIPGQIIADPDRKAVISPFIEASVNCVFVRDGDVVERGTVLACLTSPELGIKRAEYDKATAELKIEQQQFRRKQELVQEKIISEKSFEEAQLKMRVAEVNFNFAKSSLQALGISAKDIDDPPTEHSDAVGSTLHITAPIAGIVTSRNASIGQKVDAGSDLFEIIDMNTVWLEAELFEKDLDRVKERQIIKLSNFNSNQAELEGRIFHIGNKVDPLKRTVHVLAKIANEDHKLKPGMFTTARIVIERTKDTMVVPESAILEDAGVKFVFVKEPEDYHRHNVETGVADGKFIEVTKGLELGDQVVIQGGYQLKSQARMSTVDPHAGHVH